MKSKHYSKSGFVFVCSCISVNIIHLLQKICWSRTFMHIYNNVTEMVQHFRIMTKYENSFNWSYKNSEQSFVWEMWKIVKFCYKCIISLNKSDVFDFLDFWKIWLQYFIWRFPLMTLNGSVEPWKPLFDDTFTCFMVD